jgi:hypothetical protein
MQKRPKWPKYATTFDTYVVQIACKQAISLFSAIRSTKANILTNFILSSFGHKFEVFLNFASDKIIIT